jgi:hypothetical protein
LACAGGLAASGVEGQETSQRMHAVGYSFTKNCICGTSGLFFLDELGQECALYTEYGGGTVGNWWSQIGPPPGGKWQIFQKGIAYNGQPPIIYWQLAYRTQRSSKVRKKDLDELLDILSEIRSRAPGASIYVSGMTSYEPFDCPATNDKAIDKSWDAAGILWATEPDVFMGPVLPAATPEDLEGSGDSCHLGPQGMLEYGAKLHQFFDPLLPQQP